MKSNARINFLAATLLAIVLAACTSPGPQTGAPAADPNNPPPTPREFRAAWIATVANIDWPSKKGLSVAEQQAEIVRIVERARELNLNALIFQVRPAADALYASSLEPWSEYLGGEQGKAPEPFYDPLKMWVDEAHKRGIELHAWFNPYRARHISAKGGNAPSHIANTNPDAVKSYGGYLWMDPGEAFASQRTVDVILDVVRRYDIDGVHVDDYFYPYPVNVPGTMPAVEQDFPDEPSWKRYLDLGGKLSRADWRRSNVDQLMERIYTGVHREKSWVRFGISPFGLGRPDRRPPGIAGFSQYDKLYADVELWMDKGWLDYLVPQLYWPIDQPAQAFGVLQQYWQQQNTQGRHMWPGMFTSRIDSSEKSWKPEEILNQINLTRARGGALGHVHFSMVALMENRKGISDQLKTQAYPVPALIPNATWLSTSAPAAPLLNVDADTSGRKLVVTLSNPHPQRTWQFAAWVRIGGVWEFTTIPGDMADASVQAITVRFAYNLDNPKRVPDRVVAFAVDRFGNESSRATWSAAESK